MPTTAARPGRRSNGYRDLHRNRRAFVEYRLRSAAVTNNIELRGVPIGRQINDGILTGSSKRLGCGGKNQSMRLC